MAVALVIIAPFALAFFAIVVGITYRYSTAFFWNKRRSIGTELRAGEVSRADREPQAVDRPSSSSPTGGARW